MSQHSVPRWMAWMMKHLLPFDPYGSLEGEIHDVYESIAEADGPYKANRWMLGQIVRSIPSAVRNTLYWGVLMVKHYSLAALRNFKRNSVSTALNLAGLSAAVGTAIVMFVFIDLQVNMDEFHEHLDDLYLVTYDAQVGESMQTWGNSPLPLGPMAEELDVDVVNAVRMSRANAALRWNDVIFDERILFVDRDFFDSFTFPLISGTQSMFRDGNGLVISETVATKFFGDEPAVGQDLFMTLSDGTVVGVGVSAVAARVPTNASFRWNVIAPIDLLEEVGVDFNNWGSFARGTFLQLMPGADVPAVEARLASMLPQAQAANADRGIVALNLENLKSVPTRTPSLRQSPVSTVMPFSAVIFATISVLVLLLACFNYVNIAIASAMQRSREIGIRKAVGSYRTQLIAQFLGENVLLSLGALIGGIVLAEFLFIPWINSLQEGPIFELHYLSNALLWVFLAGVLAVTGLGAGLYPALFVSRFQPSRVLRGAISAVRKKRMSRFMLVTQLTFSFILLTTGAAMLKNAAHQRSLDWGYEQDRRFVVPFSDFDSLTRFKSEIERDASVVQTASTLEHIGQGEQPLVYTVDGEDQDANGMGIGFGYLEAMGVELAAGRFFDESRGMDATNAVVVNQTFADRLMGDEEGAALGQMIQIDGAEMEIIGVTTDFLHDDLIFGIDPLVMQIAQPEAHRYLIVEYAAGQAESIETLLESTWRELAPFRPYKGFSQDLMMDSYFEFIDGSARILLFISLVALVISLMGLFGLVLIGVTNRSREIGVRKALGASSWSIVRVMQRETAVVSLVALFLGIPVSWFALDALFSLLNANVAGTEAFILEWWHLLTPVVIMLFAAWASTTAGAYRGASRKPVHILRQFAS